ESRVDLAKLGGYKPLLAVTTIVLLDEGKIQELAPDLKPRHEISGLQFPLDVQALPDDRFLIAENTGNRVTERDRKGEIVWQTQADRPLMAQRLANGNTFIATTELIYEVDAKGREVFGYRRPNSEFFMKAQKLPNGDIACVTTTITPVAPRSRQFVRLD